MSWSGASCNQTFDCIRQLCVVDYIEQTASPILTAATILSRDGALLVHVAEDRIMFAAGSRYSNFRMIEIPTETSGQAELLSIPLPRGRDLNGPWITKRRVPTRNTSI
jgi:hypothetical protein